ncbi:MAG TPA: GerMN domain-containing protein, partial [Patescibacteria group bacterium]|nr:GerMN domain-containing protein [Patescibacteria group bacterium]
MMHNRLFGLVFLMLLCAGILAGCGNGSSGSQSGSTEVKTPPAPSGGSISETATVKVYFATKDALYLVPEVRTVTGAGSVSLAKGALECLAAGPKSPELVAVMPAGSAVRDLQIRDGVAYADFNAVLMKKHTGGSTAERLTVVAIVNTLTEFPDIQKVQILVEGKKVGTLAGHLDVSQPLS